VQDPNKMSILDRVSKKRPNPEGHNNTSLEDEIKKGSNNDNNAKRFKTDSN
jgi:hypothetical protein